MPTRACWLCGLTLCNHLKGVWEVSPPSPPAPTPAAVTGTAPAGQPQRGHWPVAGLRTYAAHIPATAAGLRWGTQDLCLFPQL